MWPKVHTHTHKDITIYSSFIFLSVDKQQTFSGSLKMKVKWFLHFANKSSRNLRPKVHIHDVHGKIMFAFMPVTIIYEQHFVLLVD